MSTSKNREPLFEGEGDLSVQQSARPFLYTITIAIIGLIIIFIPLVLMNAETGGSYNWIQYYGLLIFGLFVAITIMVVIFYRKYQS